LDFCVEVEEMKMKMKDSFVDDEGLHFFSLQEDLGSAF
jgi:hypothetical protein